MTNNTGDVLDLCSMSVNDTKRLNEIYDLYIGEYTEFVDQISNIWGKDWHWWMTVFASRNYFLSESYKHICIVMLAIEAIEKNNQIRKVIVPADDISRTLKKYVAQCSCNVKIQTQSSNNTLRNNVCLEALDYFTRVAKEFRKNRIVRWETRHEQRVIEDEIILIQTDVFSTCFDSGEYKARDFANILDYTEEPIYFLPYFFLNNDMSLRELVKHMMNAGKSKFLYRENYLKLIDYVKTFWFPLCCKRFCRGVKVFHQIDVTDIVNKDIMLSIRSSNSLYGMLNYFFIRRIKEKGVPVKLLIDCYEGQPSSMGLFMSFHQSYQGKDSIGYERTPIDGRAAQFAPSRRQKEYKVVPKKIGVIARVFEQTARRFESTIDTIIVPPFRLQGAFERKNESFSKRTKKILVALPYEKATAAKLIEQLDRLGDFFIEQQLSLLLKNHPANQEWTLREYDCKELRVDYQFIKGDFYSAVEKADIVLTCASTTSYETAMLGKPVIVLALSSEIVLSYMPLEWEGIRFAVAYSDGDVAKAIDLLLSQTCKPLELTGNQYLTKVNRETVSALLGKVHELERDV